MKGRNVCISVSFPLLLSKNDVCTGRPKSSQFYILCYSNVMFYLLLVYFIDLNPQNCLTYSLDLTNTFHKLAKRSVLLRCPGKVIRPGSFIIYTWALIGGVVCGAKPRKECGELSPSC